MQVKIVLTHTTHTNNLFTMRKSLFAIGLLAISYSVQAQILCHVDTNANMYVSKGTLVYSGGGMQMKGNGIIENHGNIMVSGSGTDLFKTVDASNVDKTEANGGGNFVNKLNEDTSYASPGVSSAYTYGQLFISGIPQANITGIVDQEFRAINHGTYQQIGLPFYDKTASTLSTELGKTFSNTRYSQNEILTWNNATTVSQNVDINSKLGVANPGIAYYMLGGSGLNVSTITRTLKGRPLTDAGTTVTLTNAGASVNFGTNGNNVNQYNEKYNTYLQDGFDIPGGAWQGTYGKNLYQFSNPFMTNLDLSLIATSEPGSSGLGDGVNLSTIRGVRLEVSGVTTTPAGGTGSSSYKFITFASGVPTGDVRDMMVRPMGTFVIKLNDNSATSPGNLFNFANLRRFNYTPRAANVDYNVAASKNTTGTVKQIGVIALDINGKELGRTYYVVYPNGTTGHSASAKTQVSNSATNVVGTFEEAPTGGYDYNYTSSYWLYINEANENNFLGKNVKLVNYSSNVKSYKFEIRENAALVNDGTHQLSSGTGFYYRALNGSVMQAKQGEVIPVTSGEYDLYYGEPTSVLAVETPSAKPSRTMVIYNPEITNYIVRFDPNWKKADIEVYDMSGKLVISKKAVNTSTDFVIELDGSLKNSYVVKIVSDKGETVNTKILK
ncbi:putative secreted protein (Por secretion system target) [Chryseobacterium daecheongense]|uniref:Secreted protein (Por secretion system target) n=2 Tax=Chryseobacterium daecheongense TaxID=192389 RepID=A0ABY2FVK7_9FLAO|nr:putative secreted protein (Por secretion system target) [Chryseobacterium daecheongense]